MRVLIAGCGYVGQCLGRNLVHAGHLVAGIRRPGNDPAPLVAAGIQPLPADLTRPEQLHMLPGPWDWVIHCAAPAEGGEAAYRATYLQGAENLVNWLQAAPPRAFLFTGSTSVYPQTDGSTVDETASTDGVAGTGFILRATEEFLLSAARRGFPTIILRVAGIYGPGRNRIAAVQRGDARISAHGDRWMNMIHRDDLVTAIVMALEHAAPGSLYNVSDGTPCTERQFLTWLGERLRREVPTTTNPAEAGRRQRTATNKRVDSTRLRKELGWAPRFPDFQAGYTHELAAIPDPAGTSTPNGAGTGGAEASARGWSGRGSEAP